MFLYPKISPELERYEELNFSVYNYNKVGECYGLTLDHTETMLKFNY